MRKLALAFCALLGLIGQADAAARFWNPYAVTGAVAGGTGGTECLLTISPAITGGGITTGDTINVTGVLGATGCNVTGTVTVQSSTTISLDGTTFGGTWSAGAGQCASGGRWTATNTSNWHTASSATCGLGASAVPGSADTVAFDANSLAGTVKVDFSGSSNLVTTQSLTMTNFPGTLDFNALNSGNNNITLTAATGYTDSGGTHTISMGAGNWTISGTTSAGSQNWTVNNASGTYNGNTSTIIFSGTQNLGGQMRGGGKTYNNFSFTGTGRFTFAASSANFNNFAVSAGREILIADALTIGITTLSVTGTRAAPVVLSTGGNNTGAIISSAGTLTCDWCIIAGVTTAGGGTFNATNSVLIPLTTGWTLVSSPSGGGGIIGGS